MTRYFVEGETLTAIANAVRSKTGITDPLTLDGMAEAVNGLQVGGGGSSDLARQIIDRTITKFSDDTITSLGSYAFYNCDKLTDINIPACVELGDSALSFCKGLTSIDLPSCTSVTGSSVFYACSNLTSINLPVCSELGYNAFGSCKNLTSINLPVCITLGNNSMSSCTYLTSIDLPMCTSIGSSAFGNCMNLVAVVIRSESVCELTNTNAFKYCPHILGTVNTTYNPEGLKDGYIYVPDNLVESYKTATNWSTYASQIKPLSEYTGA